MVMFIVVRRKQDRDDRAPRNPPDGIVSGMRGSKVQRRACVSLRRRGTILLLLLLSSLVRHLLFVSSKAPLK